MGVETKEYKNESIKNNEGLTESEVFKKVKEDLSPIQQNLIDKKITIDEAKQELQKVNEWLQGTNIENKDKKELGQVFDKLLKLEQNVDESDLLAEVSEVQNILEKLTRSQLDNLQKSVIQSSKASYTERPIEVQEGIAQSVEDLNTTIDNASKDAHPVAAWAGKMMKKLLG